MIQRIRDRVRQFKPQEIVSYKDWSDILNRYNYAFAFMKDDNPMYALMSADLHEAENILLENRVHEVKDVHIISETLQKIFTIGKKEQVDELVGQLKYIREFFSELRSWIERKEKLEALEAAGKVVIRREEPKDEGR